MKFTPPKPSLALLRLGRQSKEEEHPLPPRIVDKLPKLFRARLSRLNGPHKPILEHRVRKFGGRADLVGDRRKKVYELKPDM